MNNRYKLMFFVTLGVLVVTILILTLLVISNNRKEKKLMETLEKIQEEALKSKKNEPLTNKENNVESKTNSSDDLNNETDLNYTDENHNQIVENNYNTYDEIVLSNVDNEVINYLKEKETEIDTKISNGKYKEKIKSIFIEIIDFVFYGGKIKNHTFKELTAKAKLEVIKISMKIENKIEKYQPGLIDNLSEKYGNIRSKINNLYINKVDEFCLERRNMCSSIKQDYNDFKNEMKDLFNNTKEKVSDFYQSKIRK